MENNKRDYVEVIYNVTDRPLTTYPQKLTSYLFERFEMKKGDLLLDIGCGRGEFLKCFIEMGIQGSAVDQSDVALRYCPEADIQISDIEDAGIPYPDNYFDVVYSKSVIEHFYYPERMASEMYRVLKPGGIAITLCPSWEYNFKIYFEDYTHRTPFMKESLRDLQLIAGFDDVNVEFFKQLPSTWRDGSYLANLAAEITRVFAPNVLKNKFKWVRFSKEVMLLSSSRKPLF